MLRFLNSMFWVVAIWLVANLQVSAQEKQNLAGNLQFRYDSKNSSYSLWQGKTPIFQQAKAQFKLQGGSENQVKSQQPKIRRQKFQDQTGSGQEIIVEHHLSEGKKALQHFYFYEGQSFFVTEIEIQGSNLSSNHLVPFSLDQETILSGKTLQAITVPFDNDTFISYEKHPLAAQPYKSVEVGILYDEADNHGLILASLDQSIWKTGILANQNAQKKTQLQVLSGYSEAAVTRDSMEHGYIKGDVVKSAKIYVQYQKNWQDGMDTYAKFLRKLHPTYYKSWTEGTPIGWNSWGVIQTNLSFANATGTVDYFKNQVPKFRNEQGKAYIDLDSFWDNMTPGGMSGDYSKLKDFVAYCQAAGLEPGVYWAPFTDWGYGSGPDRKAEGSDYTFGEMWTKTTAGYHDLDGGRAIDPTHPGTQARMKYILQRLKDCGFRMIKIDFLAHGAIESSGFFDKNVTTGMQAYAVGMKHLNDVLDHQMLIYAAISPSLATYPYAHMRRIACDAWKTIEHSRYTLNSVTFGWWQTYLYDYIDADHLVFAGEEKHSNIVRLLSGIVTGTIILGDDLSIQEPWHEWMNPLLENQALLDIVKDGKSFRPIPPVDQKQTSSYYIKQIGKDYYFAAFNFEKQGKKSNFDLKTLGLATGNYQLTELISGQNGQTGVQLALNLAPESVQIFKLTKH